MGASRGGTAAELRGRFSAEAPAIEVGYALTSGPLELRPQFGLGAVIYRLETTAGGGAGPGAPRLPTTLAAWPGVALNVALDTLLVGVEARWAIIADAEPTFPLSLGLNGGARF